MSNTYSLNIATNELHARASNSRLIGSILLICGSSIGVGILSLPIITGLAGAVPTSIAFLGSCIYMTVTALLLLETTILCAGDANFIALSNRTLNSAGRVAVILSFAFLFYSLTTAYLAKGGELTHTILVQMLHRELPSWAGAVFLATVSGILIFMGHRIVDYLNRLFMAGFFATYLYLDTAGIQYFEINRLSHIDWHYSIFIIPFIITSFGYHNLLPTISNYLGHDRRLGAITLLASGVILFIVYMVWIIALLGIIPLYGDPSIANSFAKEEIVTQPLAVLISSPMIQYCATYMAIFAIVTSVLGQGLSIIDFMAECFGVQRTKKMRVALCLMLFIPTLICSQVIPGVFFKALEFAGGIAAMVIFGIIPGLMGWVIRYRRPEFQGRFRALVPGGKAMLIIVVSAASLLILYEVTKHMI